MSRLPTKPKQNHEGRRVNPAPFVISHLPHEETHGRPKFLIPLGGRTTYVVGLGVLMTDLAIVTLASLFAGFVDAIVGGGGLVLVPALFSVYPGAVPATLLATNKAASVWGTAWAAGQFARRVSLQWRALAPAIFAALCGGVSGAWVLTLVPAAGLRKLLPLVLLGLLAYTLTRRDLGRHHTPQPVGAAQVATACAIGAGIGFYDGFFGPGTGSFFVFLFVRFLGYDFLHASASAKFLNMATNGAALTLLAWRGHVWWQVAAVMAVANVTGSLLGTRLALKHGAGFVRVAFIVVVSALIVKTGWDALTRG